MSIASARRRRQQDHPHEFAERVEIRGAQDVPGLLAARTARSRRAPCTLPPPHHQAAPRAAPWRAGRRAARAPGEIAEHLHHDGRDRLLFVRDLVRHVLERRDVDLRHADHDPAAPSSATARSRRGPRRCSPSRAARRAAAPSARECRPCALPSKRLPTSMISAGAPSDRIVAPLNSAQCRRAPRRTASPRCPAVPRVRPPRARRAARRTSHDHHLLHRRAATRAWRQPRRADAAAAALRRAARSPRARARCARASRRLQRLAHVRHRQRVRLRRPTRASSARTIASVSGSRAVTVVPSPATVLISTEPPSARTRVSTTSIPTPRPGEIGHSLRRREARPRDEPHQLVVGESRSRVDSTSPSVRAFASTRARSMPRPSSLTRIVHRRAIARDR